LKATKLLKHYWSLVGLAAQCAMLRPSQGYRFFMYMYQYAVYLYVLTYSFSLTILFLFIFEEYIQWCSQHCHGERTPVEDQLKTHVAIHLDKIMSFDSTGM